MKTLVISEIIEMTSLVNVVSAAAVNRTDNFAYNTETNEEVYKRQVISSVWYLFLPLWVMFLVVLDCILGQVKVLRTPVSYTHLDVYKRQVQPSE